MGYILLIIGQLAVMTTSALQIILKGLPDVPGGINASATELILQGNQIRRIEDNTFDNLLILEILNLGKNPVEYISPNAFRNNLVLRQIILYEHRLVTIPEKFGEVADSLVTLYMRVKGKHTLKSMNFTDYPNLDWMTLKNTRPADGIITLKNLSSFTRMHSEYCALTSFPNLSEAPNLAIAYLTQGLFTSIPPQYLAGLTRLKKLVLGFGKLNSLPAMDKMSSLQDLNVETNNLTTLPHLYHLPLQTLTIRGNPLVCDKVLCWVRMWPFMKRRDPVTDSTNTICSSPSEAAGTPLMERHPVAMECYKGKYKTYHLSHTLWILYHAFFVVVISSFPSVLILCALTTPCGDIDISQNWLR